MLFKQEMWFSMLVLRDLLIRFVDQEFFVHNRGVQKGIHAYTDVFNWAELFRSTPKMKLDADTRRSSNGRAKAGSLEE